MVKKENIKDWRPSFQQLNKKNEWITVFYDRSWYCKETGNIHNSEKAVLNCPHCSKRYYTND